MDNKIFYAFLAALLALCISSISAATIGHNDLKDIKYEEPEEEFDPEERATWLETRDIETEFKELVYMAVEELVREGRLADITAEPKSSIDKRTSNRWQGFCFRRTRSGRFLPYICWKGGAENETVSRKRHRLTKTDLSAVALPQKQSHSKPECSS